MSKANKSKSDKSNKSGCDAVLMPSGRLLGIGTSVIHMSHPCQIGEVIEIIPDMSDENSPAVPTVMWNDGVTLSVIIDRGLKTERAIQDRANMFVSL